MLTGFFSEGLERGGGVPELHLPAFPSEGFSGGVLMARLLDSVLSHASENTAAGPLESYFSTHPHSELSAGLALLSATQRKQLERTIGAETLAELQSLSREADPEMFAESLLAFGTRQEQGGNVELAANVFSTVGGAVRDQRFQQRAQQRLGAIVGRGNFGYRVEFLGRRFAREAADPTTLLAMAAGSTVFSLTRGALLSRLLASPTANFFTQGLGARAVASTTAFLLEVPAFWATGKGLHEVLAPGTQRWDAATNLRELAGAGLTLGAMKLTGFVGETALGRMPFTMRESLSFRMASGLVTQGSMLGGILLGHRLEEAAGFRQQVDGATTLLDSLALLLQFHVGGRLSREVLGERWEQSNRELEQRLDRLAARPSRRPGIFGGGIGPELSALGIASGQSAGRGPSVEERIPPIFAMMEDDGVSGGAGHSEYRELFLSVVNRGKARELESFKQLLVEVLGDIDRPAYSSLIAQKFQRRDPEAWREAIKILGELLDQHPHMARYLAASERFREFFEDWRSRPHFSSGAQIPATLAPGTPKAYTIQQKLLPDLLRALAEDPSHRGWRQFSSPRRTRGEIPRVEELPEPDGGQSVYANWKVAGLKLRFDAHGHLLTPIELRQPFSEQDFLALRQPPAPKPLPAVSSRTLLRYGPEPRETASLWAMRLMEHSRNGNPEVSLEIAQELERRLRTPELRHATMEMVNRLVHLTSLQSEGQGILARRYPVEGLKEPLTIVSLPTTFLPESWSRVFAEGVVSEFRRNSQPVERAIEIGSGTGWMSVLLAKLGMARQIVAVDYNPHAQIVGRLNAALNGVANVEFQQGDLLAGLPADLKADLIVACLPQVPKTGSIESLRAGADYYPSAGSYMDRFGLGLIDRALEQSRGHLVENGRVLFNLGGRPGRAVLEDMLARRGFQPTIRYAQLIQQDPRTDFSALAEHETRNGLRFEFFLQSDPSTPISAAEAIGKPEVYHMLYLTEGRRYVDRLREAADASLVEPTRWAYTPEPGSEQESLRELLGQELSREWGTKISPQTLFLAPSADRIMEGLLRLLLPAGGRALAAGFEGDSLLGLGGSSVESMPPDLHQLRLELERNPPAVLLLSLTREIWGDRTGLRELLQSAASRHIHVIVREDHPAPSSDGPHPLAELLTRPEVLEFTHVVQSLDRRYETPSLPLGVAIMGNSALHAWLARYGEVTYSRTSTAIQAAYQNFLSALQPGRLSGSAPQGLIEPILTTLEANSTTAKILDLNPAFESSPRGEHPDPIDMSFGESEWRAPLQLAGPGHEALRRPIEELRRETQEAVAAYLRQSRGVSYAPEQIVLGAGVQPLVASAIAGLGRLHPGKSTNVAVPRPSYGLFFPTIDIAGARFVDVLTGPDQRFLLHPGQIAAELRAKGGLSGSVNAALVNEPSNPAGQFYTAAQVKTLAQSIRSLGGYLLFDDVFGMLDFGRSRSRRTPSLQVLSQDLGPQLVTFGGISKEFGAGGLRFGFAATQNAAWVDAMRAQLSAQPDPIGMVAAQQCFANWEAWIAQHRVYLNSRAFQLEQFFQGKNLPVTAVQGGYSMFVDLHSLYGRRFRIRGGGDVELTPANLHDQLYAQAGIKIHSDRWARYNGHYRFVFAIDRLDEAIERLRLFLRSSR